MWLPHCSEPASPASISRTLGHTAPDSLEPYLRADLLHLKECALDISNFPVAGEGVCKWAEFRSAFAPLFQSFIHYRKASERWDGASYEPFLILFDRFCASNYPEGKELTQEMVDSWCRQRESEMNNSCRSRI